MQVNNQASESEKLQLELSKHKQGLKNKSKSYRRQQNNQPEIAQKEMKLLAKINDKLSLLKERALPSEEEENSDEYEEESSMSHLK